MAWKLAILSIRRMSHVMEVTGITPCTENHVPAHNSSAGSYICGNAQPGRIETGAWRE